MQSVDPFAYIQVYAMDMAEIMGLVRCTDVLYDCGSAKTPYTTKSVASDSDVDCGRVSHLSLL